MMAERVANRQILYILTMTRSAVALAFLPVLTTGSALQDAWLTVPIACGVCVPLILAISGLGSKYPGMTGVAYSRQLLGKPAGTVVSLIFFALIFFISAADTRMYSEVIKTGFLHQTSTEFIVGVMAFLAGLAAYAGIEAIGRAADILFPLFILFVVSSLISGLIPFDPRHLEPVLARGLAPVLTGVPSAVAVSAEFIVLIILLPAATAPEKATRTSLMSVLLAGLVILSSTVVVIGVLGPWLGSQSVYPFFSMTRSLTVGRVLQRLEAVGVQAWGFALFIAVSNYTYCASRVLAEVLDLKDYRALVGPVSALWAVWAIQGYRDHFELRRFFTPHVVFPFVIVMLVVPFLVLWASYIIRTYVMGPRHGRRGGGPHED